MVLGNRLCTVEQYYLAGSTHRLLCVENVYVRKLTFSTIIKKKQES